ncbi:carcinine transporter [Thrips palmi]|uniref:Carcinine transporter n=1 Tax=Thrips palmi TaxID=161013 RepID=A0A6P8Y5P6_THRPL|nr:carcinine transporter [Thrips palmi]
MTGADDGDGSDAEAADHAASGKEPLVEGSGTQRQPQHDEGFQGRGLSDEERRRLVLQRQPSKEMDLDDLLPQIGEFGRYQKILLWFVCLPACIPCGFCAFNQLFMADTPAHWCRNLELEGLLPNMSQEHRRMLSIPKDGLNGTYSSCERYSVDWRSLLKDTSPYELEPNSSWTTEPCQDGWEYDTSEIKSSIVIDFDLVCNRDIYPTIGLAALNTGGPVGVYLFGVINDRFGRRQSFFLCLAILIAGSICTAAAPEFWSWSVSRIIVGLTIPAIYQIPFIISLELVGPNYRSFVTVMTCLFYTLGLILLAGVTYLVRNWVSLALATSLPFLFYFIYWWFLPESPRWLLAKGRLEEALKVLETLARVNQQELPDSFKQKLKQRMMLHRTQSEERRLKEGPSVFALCKTPNMRLKTALITLNWFANNMVYVGLSYYGPALGNNEYLSFLLSSLVEIPSYLACWVVMDWWGRRWPLSICMILSGISCIVTVLLPEESVTATLVLYLFSKSAISASFLIIYPFAGELYPTQMRGVGIGASGYIAGLGLILIPFITYLGRENLVLPLVIMGSISVVGGVTALRLPETLHHSLPQTVEEGEEFGKDWSMADCIQCIPKRPTAKGSYDDLSDAAESVELPSLPAPLKLPGPPGREESPRTPLNRSFDTAVRRSLSIRGSRGSRSLLVRQASTMETPIDSTGFKMTYWF